MNNFQQNLYLDPSINEYRVKPCIHEAAKYYLENRYEELLKEHNYREQKWKDLNNSIEKNSISEETSKILIQNYRKEEKISLRICRTVVGVDNFETIKTLGAGGFGKVVLVRSNIDKRLYAMKMILKRTVLDKNQSPHIRAERDALISIDTVWVTKLYHTFQDNKYLYMILEYVSGGDLRDFLMNFDEMTEEIIKYYAKELVLAISSIHEIGYIHRDLKPENIMVTADGHLKITDFGLSTGYHWTHAKEYYNVGQSVRFYEKHKIDIEPYQAKYSPEEVEKLRQIIQKLPEMPILDRRKAFQSVRKFTHSIVGTVLYMAPEVLESTGYDYLCDWWSLGTILFEMAFGYPPFYATTAQDAISKIVHFKQSLMFPSSIMRSNFIDLIKGFITSKNKRLGKNGMESICNHAFFKNESWELNLKTNSSPYIGILKSVRNLPKKVSSETFQEQEDSDDDNNLENIKLHIDTENKL